MKLNTERKAALGITAEGEDFDDEVVLRTVDGLATRAATGDTLLAARRSECLRLATVAECGSKDGQLNTALAAVINGAQGEQLEGLITMYTAKAEERFPHTCQSCGTQNLSGRSSVEDRAALPNVRQQSFTPNGADTLHG